MTVNACMISLGSDTTQTGKTKAAELFDTIDIGNLLKNRDKKITLPGSIAISEPYDKIVDKNGVVREGKIIENEPRSLADVLSGKEAKPLATVKAEQVNKFLQNIQALGLDLKAEDIMSSNGTLNPNFKVDDKGNISFRNVKDFINGKAPEYFETSKGQWAKAKKENSASPFLTQISYPVSSLPKDLKLKPLYSPKILYA